MSTPRMKGAPQLPLMTMPQCVAVFKEVGIPSGVLARISGFARMQVFRWLTLRTTKPLPVTLEYVNELAYKMMRAERASRIPPASCHKLRPWADALNDDNFPVPFRQSPLDNLMSPHWADVIAKAQKAHDATV